MTSSMIRNVGEYTIVTAKEGELNEIMNINLSTLPEHYTEDFYYEILGKFPEGFLLAENEGVIVGYIMNRVEVGFSNFGFSLIKKGHVVSIAILENFRGKGLGKALMEEAIKAMEKKGCKEVFLEVRISNKIAINLYTQLGFKIIRTLDNYYTNGENAYLMTLSI